MSVRKQGPMTFLINYPGNKLTQNKEKIRVKMWTQFSSKLMYLI